MQIPGLPEDLSSVRDDQYAAALFALLEKVQFDYERFCYILELDPNDNEVFEWWYMIHSAYAETWRVLGNDGFDQFMSQWAA